MKSITRGFTILQDVKKSGKERNWKGFKLDNLSCAGSFKRNGNIKKYYRMKDCGGFLEFGECPNGCEKKLTAARFCQVRLCPMCAARRSTLVFQNLRQVVHEAKERGLQFVFLTLTAKNVKGDSVKTELTKYFEAFKKLTNRRPFKVSVEGWFRALEITHKWRKDEYHPHFHCLLAVKPSYFKGGKYIKHATWVQWWRESMQLDYDPIVDVRRVKARKKASDEIEESGAIFEVAKYTTKSNDYLIPESQKAQDRAVEILDDALQYRRLIAYGGILNKIRRELKQVDEEKHDLIKVGEDAGEGCNCSECNAIYQEVSYKWHVGLRDYVRVDDLDDKGRVIDKETGEIIE